MSQQVPPPAVPPEATEPPYASAPRWRRQPYRVFFALGLLHAWAGVSPWFFLALGQTPGDDRRPYHSIAQIQGFLICFAVGFLFTMIPRRTNTKAPTALEMLLGMVCPVGTTIFAAFGNFAVSQMFWLLMVVTLGNFLIRRMRAGRVAQRPPPGMIWVPIAFLMGLIGSACFAIYGMLGQQPQSLHHYGKLFLLQGMFLGLVVGVGGLVFPLFTRGESPDANPLAGRFGITVHLVALAALITSFVVEVSGYPVEAYAMRSLLLLAVLVFAARIHRLPRLPGVNRWLVWGTAWMLPLGYAMAAWYPSRAHAGLHVVYIAGFASMAFAVGMHVSLAHGGRKYVVGQWPWQIVSFAGLFLLATVARVLMNFDHPDRYLIWMGVAAGSFLVGTVLWAALAVPSLIGERQAT